jgi:hypothetical protein
MFDNIDLKTRERDSIKCILFSEIQFTGESAWTDTHWQITTIKITSTTIKTIRNCIIAWIDQSFTETRKKLSIRNLIILL